MCLTVWFCWINIEALIRNLINGLVAPDYPSPDYHKMANELRAIGNTEYIVKSKFDKNANECLIGIVLRWLNNNADVS